MSGVNLSSNFLSPALLKLLPQAPIVFTSTSLENHKAQQAVINNIYEILNGLARSDVIDSGIGPRNIADQPILAGQASTIKAGNVQRLYVPFTDAANYGSIINLYSNAGVLSAQLAVATTNAKPADGICNTPGSIAIGDVGEVLLSNGVLIGSGMTVGQRCWLSAVTAGALATSAPVAAGNIEQYLGIVISPTEFYFHSHYWLQH